MLDQLHERQWISVQETIDTGGPFPWSGLEVGRTLVTALLDGLSAAMPPTQRAWPAIVMRELVPTIVRSRLGLERSGFSGLVASTLCCSTGTAWLAVPASPRT